MKKKLEPYIHGISMRGLKVGSKMMPLRWPKVFEGDSPAVEMCKYIVKKGKSKSVLFVTSKTPVRTGLVNPLIETLEKGGISHARAPSRPGRIWRQYGAVAGQ